MKPIKSGVTVTYEYDKWFDAPNQHDNDVVRVIRCKDCVFWEHAFDDWGKCYGIMAGLGTYESGFCAWAERKEELDCNDCYYSMQNCNDRSVCCEDETALCDNFEPVAERKEE